MTIEKLRAELAAANERLAFQSAQFRDELRRLRTSTPPAPRIEDQADSARRSLADRIKEANPALAASLRGGPTRKPQKAVTGDQPGAQSAAAGPDGDATAGGSGPNGASHPKAEGNGHAEPHKETANGAESADGAAQSERLLDRIAGISKS